MTDSSPSTTEPSPAGEPPTVARRKRRRLPRFGLRSLFVFGLIFSLAFGWIGKNLYRMRQEDAAIETIKRAGGSVLVATDRGIEHHPATPYRFHSRADWSQLPSTAARLVGVAGPLAVKHVDLGEHPAIDPIEDEAWAALTAFPALEGLSLYGPAVDDEALDRIPHLPALKEIGLHDTEITGKGLATLTRFPALRHLTARPPTTESDLLAGLPALDQLRSMQLFMQGISRDELAAVAAMQKLERLALTHVTLDGADVFEPLGEAASIREFRLSLDPNSRPLTESDVEAFCRLPNVEVLALRDFDPAFLASVEGVDSLRALCLHGADAERAVGLDLSAKRPACLVQIVDPDEVQFFLAGEEIEYDAGVERMHAIGQR